MFFVQQCFITYIQETWYEVLIRYGLYLGAVFQMACIMVTDNIVIIIIIVIVILIVIIIMRVIVVKMAANLSSSSP